MKKIMNQPEAIVLEMANGIVMAHPGLELLPLYRVVKKREIDPQKVSLISGGGSGHEPAHAGFVGKGMLDAAVCGDVFASPSQIQIYHAIQATQSKKGTLLIVKNYSGDVMNFRNAAYMAEADGITVDYVRVQDDIAVMDSLYTVGRRGVAGTVLVHKVAGAAAERGDDLAAVKAVAQKAADNVKSLGFALSSCTVPAAGKPTFDIVDGEMEFGVGIHGEPGIQREQTVTAEELAARMTSRILGELALTDGQEVAVMVNGFGATPLMELYLLNHYVMAELDKAGVKVYREYVGNYMTSIDMAGASLSIMKLDDELKALLDAPSDTPALKVDGRVQAPVFQPLPQTVGQQSGAEDFSVQTDSAYANIGDKLNTQNMLYILDLMSHIIIENEAAFCELDSHAGDGDFGMSIARGFRQLKREWKRIAAAGDIGELLDSASRIIMEYCGGASGPIWGFAFLEAGRVSKGKKALDVASFADMMQAAVAGIQATGERSFGRGAQVGDKTLIDALAPCADAWTASAQAGDTFAAAFAKGARAAVDGADKTKDIVARMGRAGALGERSIGYPDAGAQALGIIFTQIAEKIG